MPILLGAYGALMLGFGIFLGTLIPQDLPEYRENESLMVCNAALNRSEIVMDSIDAWIHGGRIPDPPPVVIADS